MIRCAHGALTVLFAMSSVHAQQKRAPAADSGFTVRKLAEGVYAAVRNEPLGLINESNSLFIIGERDVIVVDAQSSSARTRETLAALKKLTTKPVSALIHTHWHDDHMIGNDVYASAFPGLEIVGHATMKEDLESMGVEFRKSAANRAQTIAALKDFVQKEQSYLGGKIDAEESRSHQLSAWLVDDYSNGAPDFRPHPPTLTVDDKLVLHQGKRDIEVQFLGKGHTRGDLVVFLPKERILATGDLLMWPVQFVGSTSYPQEFAGSVDRIRTLKPLIVVPGHGRVLTEREADTHASLVARTIRSIVEQATAAVGRGETLEQAKTKLDLAAFQKEMAGSSRLRQVLFDYYVRNAGYARAFELAGGKK